MESFDYAIIGAGPGGYVSAIRASQLGLKTALIEKESSLGGTCLNVGCIPSKALLEASEWYAMAGHKFDEAGIGIGKLTLDLKRMMERKAEIVKTLTVGIGMLMKKNKVNVLRGTGKLTGKNTITIAGESAGEIEAKSICLAMGSLPVELPFLKFDGEQIVSSTEALSFDKVPKHLVVIGAGAVGLELGSVWRRLGAKVTVIEMLPQITPFADKQMAVMLQRALTAQGMEIMPDTKVTGAETGDGGVTVHYEDAKGERGEATGDKVLVSVGRRPFSEGAGLDAAGVKVDESGRIPVDGHWRTGVENIHAIGDLIDGPMLAHKAEDEGVAVAEIVAGGEGHVNYEAIPNIVYTWPEMAAVGMTEAEAKEKGHEVKVGKFYFRGNGRALTMSESEGLVKIVADAKSDRVLGVHIVGPRASELIAEAVIAMEFSASAEDIARTVHAHPTLAEAVKEAALAVDKRAIHA